MNEKQSLLSSVNKVLDLNLSKITEIQDQLNLNINELLRYKSDIDLNLENIVKEMEREPFDEILQQYLSRLSNFD